MKTRRSTKTKLSPFETTKEDEVPRKKPRYSHYRVEIEKNDKKMEVDDVSETSLSSLETSSSESLSSLETSSSVSESSNLYSAIQNQDIKLVDKFLKQKINLNAIPEDSSLPYLHLAVNSRNLNIIKKLIDYKAEIGIFHENKTALHLAVEQGDKEIIKILLKTKKNKSKINARKKGHDTPLLTSIKFGNYEIFKFLVDSGACIKMIIHQKDLLHYVAKNNAHKIAEYLINQGAYVDSCIKKRYSQFYQYTPLCIAIKAESFEMVKLLVYKGANINVETICRGKKPLHIAIEKGNIQVFKLLKDAGADIKKSYKDIYPFHWAAYHNSVEIAQYLVDNRNLGINSLCCSCWSQFYRYTPLHIAIQQENVEVTKFIIKNGINVNITGRDGQTALTIAIKKNNLELFNLLWDPKSKFISNSTRVVLPLHQAIVANNDFAIHFLIEFGVDINAICNYPVSKYSHCTPLQLAVAINNLAVVKLLLEKRADINKSTEAMGTPLAVAVDNDNYKLYNFLIKSGANVKMPLPMTLLHRSVNINNYRITQDLIRRGLDVNALNEHKKHETYKYSPLQIAVTRENLKITKLLIRSKAKVNDERCIKTALGIACEQANYELVKILFEGGANVNEISDEKSPLHLAICKGNYEIVEYLIKCQADVNINSKNDSPLHLAVKARDRKMIELLLKNIALVNWSHISQPILMLAVENSDFEVIKMLVNAGADVKATNNKLYSLLRLAIKQNSFDIVKLLVDLGADLNANDVPLYWAVSAKNYEITEYLITHGTKNIDQCPPFQYTPLHVAVKNQDINIVSLLLKFNPNINFAYNYPTVLGSAIKTSNLKLIELLLKYKGLDINAPCYDQCTPIELAVEKNNIDLVKLLLKYHVNINFQIAQNNRWFISHVGYAGRFEMLKFFINNEIVETNYKDPSNGETFLHLAIKCRSFKKAEFIILKEDFVNINALANGETAFDLVVKYETTTRYLSDLLLNSGIDIGVIPNKKVIYSSSIKEHMIKLKASGHTLNDYYLNIVNNSLNNFFLNNIYIECLKEIELTKNVEIDSTKLSYYDILRLSQHDIAIRLNQFNGKKLDKSSIVSQFPLYGSMIYYKLIKACQRKEILIISTEMLAKLLYE
ncbi:hypothetical protein KQX54_003273 [Cotesia glomerata]|uniref:Uncharacterized protein n=1 Tax=Cotesia glomerata TaxID=32391 RepID=A0AAV7I6K5_COTGL|nr:hypothetical protein KQX54_003273 [Cotesia glomerata]